MPGGCCIRSLAPDKVQLTTSAAPECRTRNAALHRRSSAWHARYGSKPRSCSGTPVQPLSPVVGAEARRTRTSPQVAFCHADSESAARACRCAPDVTCAGRHVLLDRSFVQRAVQPPNEDELVWHTCCIALQTGCTGIQHAVLCCNRQAKAELDGLRIEMSLVHDDIDNRHSTATALWVTAPCQPSPSLRPVCDGAACPRVAPIEAWHGRPGVCHASAWCRRHASLTALRASIGDQLARCAHAAPHGLMHTDTRV